MLLGCFDLALRLYPAAFRGRFGSAMRQAFMGQISPTGRRPGARRRAVSSLANTAVNGLAERRYERRRVRLTASSRKREPMRSLIQDLRFAARRIRASS